MMHAFVTGTDTGVGKTTLCAGLLAAAVRRGLTTAVMKPVESGTEPGCEGDAELLQRASGSCQPMEEIRLYSFPEPVAPGVAAAAHGVDIDLLRVVRQVSDIRARHPHLFLVEGAGGLLVPLGSGHQIADLARLLSLPLLVVARDSLGTINHTLLTVEAARARGLTVRGVVLVSTDGATPPDRVESNLQEIERAGGVQVLGRVPFLVSRGLDELAAACDPILGALLPD